MARPRIARIQVRALEFTYTNNCSRVCRRSQSPRQTCLVSHHRPPTPPSNAARFSPDDKFSRQRLTIKKRFNLLPTQKPVEDI